MDWEKILKLMRTQSKKEKSRRKCIELVAETIEPVAKIEGGEITKETTEPVAETIEPVAENNFPIAVATDLTIREGRN